MGQAHDASLRSGCTVLTADRPFTAAVHIMGGAPGTRETDLLAPDKLVQEVDALVLSGGSAFGLDACSGVADALRAQGRGFAVGDQRVPIVPGAILFDLLNGGDKTWARNPYYNLGRQAYLAAVADFALRHDGRGIWCRDRILEGRARLGLAGLAFGSDGGCFGRGECVRVSDRERWRTFLGRRLGA